MDSHSHGIILCTWLLCPVKYSPALFLIRGRVSRLLNQTYHRENTHREAIDGVCVRAVNQHISRNKHIQTTWLHSGYWFIPLPVFLFASPSFNNIQMMHILRTQAYLTSTRGTSCCTWVCVSVDARSVVAWLVMGVRHMLPITRITLGSQNKPLNSCWPYWALD